MSKYQAQMDYAKRHDLVKIGYTGHRSTREELKRVCGANNVKYGTLIKRYVEKYIEENGGKIK